MAKEAKASTLAALQTAMRESEYDINVTESGKRPVDEAKVALADLQAQLEMSMQADPTAVGRHQRLKAEVSMAPSSSANN